MLAEATTIQKAKDLKDLALTAAEWARRKGMGEEAVQYARGFALDAERRMGQMLKESEDKRAKGGRPTKETSTHTLPVSKEPTLSDLGITKQESAKAQKLYKMPEEKFKAVREGKIPLVQAMPHVLHNTGQFEWYTPPKIIEAVRKTLGSIDCDPASSKIANKTIKATLFYTEADNGLIKKWGKRCFINPPYSQPLVAQFSEALVSKYKKGEVSAACILVNNSTDSEWFQNIIAVSSAVCFFKGRIRFLNADGNIVDSTPLQGQAVIYLGEERNLFAQLFQPMGIVLFRGVS